MAKKTAVSYSAQSMLGVREALAGAREFFSNFTPVPPSEWLHAMRLFSVTRVAKGDYYWRQGEPFRRIGILVKGLSAAQYEREDGTIRIRRFFQPGAPVGPYPGLIYSELAEYAMIMYEDSVVAHMDYGDWEHLLTRHRCWETIARKGNEKELIARERREAQLSLLSATERYMKFLEDYPGLEARLPQYAIASYVGITPVALSRIRKRLS